MNVRSSDELKQKKLLKEISAMKSPQLINSLKEKGLPVFGTMQQKRDRLLGYYGMNSQVNTGGKISQQQKQASKKDSTLAAIDKINQNRENRRRKMEEKKRIKLQREVDNQELGVKCDVDFQLMVEHEKSKVTSAQAHKIPDIGKINI